MFCIKFSDGPANVTINMLIRSISTIDDVTMVSSVLFIACVCLHVCFLYVSSENFSFNVDHCAIDLVERLKVICFCYDEHV